jgi:hypothetical protein
MSSVHGLPSSVGTQGAPPVPDELLVVAPPVPEVEDDELLVVAPPPPSLVVAGAELVGTGQSMPERPHPTTMAARPNDHPTIAFIVTS